MHIHTFTNTHISTVYMHRYPCIYIPIYTCINVPTEEIIFARLIWHLVNRNSIGYSNWYTTGKGWSDLRDSIKKQQPKYNQFCKIQEKFSILFFAQAELKAFGMLTLLSFWAWCFEN